MTGFEMPALAGFVSAIQFLFGLISKGSSLPVQQRRQWFEDHIKPSYDEIRKIHEDYTAAFTKVLSLLRSNGSLKEAVQILQAERPNKLLYRQEVQENLNRLKTYRMEKRRKPEIIKIFYDYVSSVDDYLNAASPIPQETWYGYFIRTFAELVERGEDPMTYDYPGCAQGSDAPRLAVEKLLQAVQQDMPQALRHVQENYAKLQALCLTNV